MIVCQRHKNIFVFFAKASFPHISTIYIASITINLSRHIIHDAFKYIFYSSLLVDIIFHKHVLIILCPCLGFYCLFYLGYSFLKFTFLSLMTHIKHPYSPDSSLLNVHNSQFILLLLYLICKEKTSYIFPKYKCIKRRYYVLLLLLSPTVPNSVFCIQWY